MQEMDHQRILPIIKVRNVNGYLKLAQEFVQRLFSV